MCPEARKISKIVNETSLNKSNMTSNYPRNPVSTTSSTASVSYPNNKCELNSKGYLNFSKILKSFHAPINEEHAWGICYQFSKAICNILENLEERKSCHLVEKINQLFIHQDGFIHKDSFLQSEQAADADSEESQDIHDHGGGYGRIKSSNEFKLVHGLGLVIFDGLHFGMAEDEERNLSQDLDNLLDLMNSAGFDQDHEQDDEGFEPDTVQEESDKNNNNDKTNITFQRIIQLSSRRLGSSYSKQKDEVDSYYKSVCRALVSESIELSTFLQKVSQGTKTLIRTTAKALNKSGSSYSPTSCGNNEHADLDQLNFNDWARLWMQVVGQLRNGIKLKKVDDLRNTPVEFTLTPYEILMDDIRSKHYQLKTVTVNGDIPQRVKKSAHDIILEFIRSRPPLKSAQDRILSPRPDQKLHPIELLMEDIRKEHTLKPVKKVSPVQTMDKEESNLRPATPSSQDHRRSIIPVDIDMTDLNLSDEPEVSQRRLIKADISQLSDFDFQDHDEEESQDEYENQDK